MSILFCPTAGRAYQPVRGIAGRFDVPHVQQLHQRLITAGVENHCAIYTGGHDYAWWRGALIDGIGLLQG